MLIQELQQLLWTQQGSRVCRPEDLRLLTLQQEQQLRSISVDLSMLQHRQP